MRQKSGWLKLREIVTRPVGLLAVLIAGLLLASTHLLHGQQACPCGIWSATTTPGPVANDSTAVELGVKFTPDTNGFVTGVRFYKYAQNTGTHIGNLWTTSGTLLGTVTFTTEAASGWQVASFASPVAVTANTTYIASYHTNVGFYAATQSGLAAAVDNAPLHALSDSAAGGNGVYQYGASSTFPNQSYLATNYWVDVVYTTNAPPDTTPPTVLSTSPSAGAAGISTATNVTVTFSEAMKAATVTGSTVQLRDAGNALVPATVAYSSATNAATLTPSAGLATTAAYTLTVTGGAGGVQDLAGNALVAGYTASFTTASGVGCPCSLWSTSTTPGPMAADGGALELGMKFRTDSSGVVNGVRFYKYAQNTGSHIGNLWSAAGALLGTVTFSNESASGWQQANFASPIAITANTTYVISYYTSAGFYAASNSFFASGVDNTPLHALADATAPGNGVYFYSSSSAFPNQSYQATNYWVDVIFSGGSVDTTAPTVSMSAPANGATVSGTAVPVSATAADNVGVAGVQFKLDGANFGALDTVSPYSVIWDSTTAANGNHTLTAVASDAAGNTTTATSVTVTVSNDTTAPTVSMSAPANGATVSGTTVALSATAADNVGVVGVQFKLDGANFGALDTVSPYSIVWNSTTVVNGSHTLTAVASDAAGNTTTATSVTVTVSNDTTAPTVSMSAPANGATVSGTTVTLSATAADNVGVVGVQFKLDGANLGALDTVSPYSIVWNSTTVANGSHTLTAVATDAAGNSTTAVSITLTVSNDTTPPTVSMTAPTNGATVSGTTVTVSATAADNVGVVSVQFKLDGANLGALDTVSPYSVTWNSTTAANGSHTLTAVASDAAGNTTTATAVTVTASNDTTAPTVSMTTPANGATVAGAAVTVSAAAADNIGVVGVQFLLDGVATGAEVTTAPYAVVWNTTGSSNGAHTVAARARDAAGNTTTSTAVSVTVANGGAATLVMDTTAFGDRSSSASTIATSAFSTTGGNELLLAFVASDSNASTMTVTGVSGASLTWQLAVRTNTQRGTAEVWRAFAPSTLSNVTVTASLSQAVSASITVVSFKGADGTGTNGSAAIGATKSANANPGAPTATLTTTRAGSWVFGVGNDWDNDTSRTVGGGQTMVHQFLATAGDTYWVQRTTTPTASAGTNVTINDTAPTGDRYNLSLVEILPGLADTTPPSIVSTTPASGATGVSPAVIVTVKFSEAMNPVTITAANLQLRDGSNALVPSVVTYDVASATALIAPTQALSASAAYTATVQTGVQDTSGNTLPSAVNWSFATSSSGGTGQGAGGPILVVSNALNPFSLYYAEILRAEGLNEFAVADISQVSSSVLAGYDLVILGQQTLTTAQVTMITNWVQGGGKLIAMRPDKKLASLLSLATTSLTLSNSYLAIDTTKAPGTGLVSQTMQFHGTADEYNPVDATVVATLYSDAVNATASPAVTLYANGAGQAAAFTFDLAQSVIYTRQGNPAWVGQGRDGNSPPVRPDDMFFGASPTDFQPDWVDLSKVQIPQADEQQRLLANLILKMTSGGKPLPRFWYLPFGNKAAVVLTGDDHALGGTTGRLAQYIAASTPGCVVANWACVRSTAYVYPNAPMTDAQVASLVAQGFEISVHVTMDPQGTILCGSDFTAATLQTFYASRLAAFAAAFPSAPAPTTHRMHCVMWSDWASQPLVESQNGIRLDTTYYYWPAAWVNDNPGLFTGSGMPMRFANTDGSMIDVYQATTQMTDESGQTYPLHIDTLLNNALGATGYYGVFTANMHNDVVNSPGATSIIASAQAHNVPVISASQLLTWVDGRNNSSFGPMTWSGTVLTFSVAQATGASGLQMMVPAQAGALHMTTVTLNGAPVTTTTQTIKGISYAFITVGAGQYRVTYAP